MGPCIGNPLKVQRGEIIAMAFTSWPCLPTASGGYDQSVRAQFARHTRAHPRARPGRGLFQVQFAFVVFSDQESFARRLSRNWPSRR